MGKGEENTTLTGFIVGSVFVSQMASAGATNSGTTANSAIVAVAAATRARHTAIAAGAGAMARKGAMRGCGVGFFSAADEGWQKANDSKDGGPWG